MEWAVLTFGQLDARAVARGKGHDDQRADDTEGAALLAAIGSATRVVALDGDGKPWSSEDLAGQLAAWRMDGRDMAFVIGGPDGHVDAVLARAE